MNTYELIVTGAITAIMGAAGVNYLSPDAEEAAENIAWIARAQDGNLSAIAAVSGKFLEPVAPITAEEINSVAAEVRAGAAGPEAEAEAQAAAERFNENN